MPGTETSVLPNGGNAKSSTSKPSPSASSCLGIFFIVIGVVLMLVGVVYGVVIPKKLNQKLIDGLALCTAEDYTQDSYVDPYGDCDVCNPRFTNLYLFNITNPTELLTRVDARLAVQELGPYAFRKRSKKLKVEFSLENDQVSFYQYDYYTFDQDKSCSTCRATDKVIAFDLGVIGLLSSNTGEIGFLNTMLSGAGLSPSEYIHGVAGAKIMQVFYGYNSMNPLTLKALGGIRSYGILGKGLPPATLIAALPPTTGLDYYGVVAKRTVLDIAVGRGSFFIGMVVGGFYVKKCAGGPNLNQDCVTCRSAGNCSVAQIKSCVMCDKGAAILAVNDVLCRQLQATYAHVIDPDEAEVFANSTCMTCATTGMCIAPVPGPLGSGLPWSDENVPTVAQLKQSILQAGCSDKTHIGEYVQYNGAQLMPLAVNLDERRNPTLIELMNTDRSCATNPKAYCSKVSGGDATYYAYGGLTGNHLAQDVPIEARDLWIPSVYQNVTVHNTHEKVTVEGINMVRFKLADDALSYKDSNIGKGTGIPVDGLQSLSWVTNFLMYMAFPMFLHGNDSLLANVDITLNNSVKATKDTLYESDGTTLKAVYADRFATYVDVEPATGRSMNARSRLMAATAISKSPNNPLASFLETTAPLVPTEVVFPLYWVEDVVTVSQANAEKFIKKLVFIVKTFTPVTIFLLMVGLLLILVGCCNRRRAKHTVVPH